MNAYNPLASMKRLEEAGVPRTHAEAIAAEIGGGLGDLVTSEYLREQLDAALARHTIKNGILTSGIVAVATTILGMLIALK